METRPTSRPRIAIVGTGIAGLGCAHFLQRAGRDFTVFEQAPRLGGHAHTVEVGDDGSGRSCEVDTGFAVFNRTTYPLLSRLFDELQVPVKPAPMSFSVRDDSSGTEWCGASLNGMFAQRKNLLGLRFWRMLFTIARFNREALRALDDPAVHALTLGDYVRRRGYRADLFNRHVAPLCCALWHLPPERLFTFPAAMALRVFRDLGLLGRRKRHAWLTVEGGSREYVRRLAAPFRERIHAPMPVARLFRHGPGRGVTVLTTGGASHAFDQVVLATRADQALRLIVNPTPAETRALGAFGYRNTVATLHTDESVMPRTRRAWASWNLQLARDDLGRLVPATHVWVNRLQGTGENDQKPIFVSLDRPQQIAPDKIVETTEFSHPLFDLGTVEARRELPALNAAAPGATDTFFAGGYFGDGFHEDAFASAVDVARLLLGREPW